MPRRRFRLSWHGASYDMASGKATGGPARKDAQLMFLSSRVEDGTSTMSGESEMQPAFSLISHHLCPYVQRAAIALAERGIPFERTYIDLAAKPDWFKAISPLGKVPVLRVGDAAGNQTNIFESAVILEYLEETSPSPLHPGRPARTGAASRLDRIRLAAAQRHRPLLFGDGRGRVRT